MINYFYVLLGFFFLIQATAHNGYKKRVIKLDERYVDDKITSEQLNTLVDTEIRNFHLQTISNTLMSIFFALCLICYKLLAE